MFTNWLTGTTGNGSNKNSPALRTVTAAKHCVAEQVCKFGIVQPISAYPTGRGAHVATPSTSIAVNTPPDVLLEVGPAPGNVRFMAHSLVLGMHSGYLRSAIRLDDTQAITATMAGSEPVLYLGNVTADQFAPLLSYMYTGYLELNVENIFGVLLATHLLHMPRALEICRSFLARAQTEGFLGNSVVPAAAAMATESSATIPLQMCNSGKVIRPIASKATMPNYGFLPLSTAPTAQSQPLPNGDTLTAYTTADAQPLLDQITLERDRRSEPRDEIDVEQHSESSRSTGLAVPNSQIDVEEDDEVFIDSNSDRDSEASSLPPQRPTVAKRKSPTPSPPQDKIVPEGEIITAPTVPEIKTQPSKPAKLAATARRSDRQRNASSNHRNASGLEVAKAPMPASQLGAMEDSGSTASKVIIDVASCDGPVRFRRILNTAYGHKLPEVYAAGAMQERTQLSVSLSFHQQMAKTISQQQQQQQHAEESENSESSSERAMGKQSGVPASGKSHELYVCVYCKHTFKSQYCYQKHAKRHLNPLSLSCANMNATATEETLIAAKPDIEYDAKLSIANIFNGASAAASTIAGDAKKHMTSELLRREVRPLDMNVQYYPCKTCGSKFPSYYFVHKHRKLCHADEEAAPGTATETRVASRTNINDSGQSGSAQSMSKETATNITSNIVEQE